MNSDTSLPLLELLKGPFFPSFPPLFIQMWKVPFFSKEDLVHYAPDRIRSAVTIIRAYLYG